MVWCTKNCKHSKKADGQSDDGLARHHGTVMVWNWYKSIA